MDFLSEHKKANRSATNSRNRKRGAKAEDIVREALAAAGYACIEPIHTGWVILRKMNPVTKKQAIVSAFPKEKVTGDFKAIQPVTGRLVHCEVKARPGNLQFSALEDHQVEALDRITNYGGIGLLAWVKGNQCRLYRWPIIGFLPGRSLKWGDAEI